VEETYLAKFLAAAIFLAMTVLAHAQSNPAFVDGNPLCANYPNQRCSPPNKNPLSLNQAFIGKMDYPNVTVSTTIAPTPLPGSQQPFILYNFPSDNLAPVNGNIEGIMELYTFGGAQMTGNRFAHYTFMFNNAITANTFGEYAANYGEAYTFLGDGGTMGDPKGFWFGSNYVCFIDAGAGLFNGSCVGQELDTVINAAAGSNYVMGLNIVGSNAAHGTAVDAALVIGGSNIGGNVHTGWNDLMLLSDINDENPVNANSVFFDTFWVGGGTKAMKTWANLTGLVFSQFIINSTPFFIDHVGNIGSSGGIAMSGTQVNFPNAAVGTATKYVCSDNAGNWWAQSGAC
jgi:hypothetical protein